MAKIPKKEKKQRDLFMELSSQCKCSFLHSSMSFCYVSVFIPIYSLLFPQRTKRSKFGKSRFSEASTFKPLS